MALFAIVVALMAAGFFASLGLGYAMRPWRRFRTETIFGVSILIGFITPFALVGLLLFGLAQTGITDHFSEPVTAQQAHALSCPFNVPDSATKVQFGEASGGFPGNFEYLVRFEAPLDVCRASVRGPLEPLKERPSPISGFMFRDAPWFDIQNISHGEKSGDDGQMGDEFWIDDDRGIFYFRKRG